MVSPLRGWSFAPLKRPSRIPSRPSGAGVLEALGRHFSVFFDFWTHLQSSCMQLSMFGGFESIFGRFGIDFGRIWGGFWEDLSMNLGDFFEISDFTKTSKKPRFLQCFMKVEIVKISKYFLKN